jgi:uncharacterized protein
VIFVDTSAWFDAEIATGRDPGLVNPLVERHHEVLATSTATLVELWNLLAARAQVHRATPACLDIAQSVTLLHPDARDHAAAANVLRTWPGRDFSYCDALSFALMERLRIETALSLDDDFRVYRYGPDRTRAFRVLPE